MIVKTREKLRALKAEKRVTNVEIANHLGYSKSSGPQNLSRIMNGIEYVSTDKIQRIANAIIEISKIKSKRAS